MAQSGAEYIFNELSLCFPIEHPVLQVIVDQLVDQTSAMKLNKLTIQPIFKQLRKSCPKSNLGEMNILFKCCYVLIVSLRESSLLMHDMEELFMDYPEFRGLPADELKKLLKFRNAMKMSLQLIEAKHHKGELLDICGRLSGKMVTTGGSQTTETKRRVMIYEREGGLEAEKSVLKGKKRKGEFDVKIKEEVFSPSNKKPCPLEAGPLLSRNVGLEQTVCGRVIKPEPSLLPAHVALFVSQQLNHKFSASDAATYMSIIEKTVIQTTTDKELNKLTLRPILKDLRKLFPRKEIWAEMNILFKCCYVLMLSLRDDSLLWIEQSQFLEHYCSPEFQNLTSDEVQKLMAFRNAMKLALQLIEAKHHKGELLEIAGRLSGRVVTTGGGQTLDTTRCVMIYEQEGGNYSERIERKPVVGNEPTAPLPMEHSAFEFEGICRLESMRNDDLLSSQFSQQEYKPACLERAASTASLMGTFSLQSNDAYGLFRDFSVGNLLSDPCLSLSGLTPSLTLEAHTAQVVQEAHMQELQCPSLASSSGSSKHTTSSVTITAVHREGDTDIDTELDSVEVATDVDENEHHLDEDDEGEMMPDADKAPQEAPYCDARELYEMLRSQSMPLESQEYQYGLGMSQGGLGGIVGIGGIGGAGKTDSVSSVDLCTGMGIARLGSLPSISPDMFKRDFTSSQ